MDLEETGLYIFKPMGETYPILYSYTVSRARRRLKQEIKRFNLKSSTVLAKNQKSLRYLASHPRYEDKFAMLGYIPAEIKKMEAESE